VKLLLQVCNELILLTLPSLSSLRTGLELFFALLQALELDAEPTRLLAMLLALLLLLAQLGLGSEAGFRLCSQGFRAALLELALGFSQVCFGSGELLTKTRRGGLQGSHALLKSGSSLALAPGGGGDGSEEL